MKTLNDFLTDYLEWRTSLRMSHHTTEKNRYSIAPFLQWLESLSVITPDGIQKHHMISWQKQLATTLTRQGRPLKPLSINTKVESIKGFLGYLV